MLGEDFFVKAGKDYALYRFIKARVTQGVEWDQAEYLQQRPELMCEEKERRRERTDDSADGLHASLPWPTVKRQKRSVDRLSVVTSAPLACGERSKQ